MFASKRRFLRELWTLIKPYWTSEERLASGALLAVIVGMSLGLVFLSVLLNKWNNLFYNALQDKDFTAFMHLILRFCLLAAAFILVAVYQLYLRQMLQIRWRRWLTERYVGVWMRDRAYYRLQLTAGPTDNPDQRISEDINSFVGDLLVLSLGLLESVATLVSFSVILWGLSGDFAIASIRIPGFMLWAAAVYAGAGSVLTHLIGKPLIRLNFMQQRFEADYRFSLVRVRENAEAIALYGGESEESRHLGSRFVNVVTNWWNIMRRQKRLTWFTAGYSQAAVVFPFLVAAPRYFTGAIQLGGLMQTAQAFGQVQGALSWFIDAYSRLAGWRATVERLTGFTQDLAALKAEVAEGLVRLPAAPGEGVTVTDLRLFLPDGTPLTAAPASLTFAPGSRTMVAGPPGCGKSTLFRAISGLWPYCQGQLSSPEGERILFVPQKPYLPIAPLKAAVTYPDPWQAHGEQAIAEALDRCGLSRLAGSLAEERHWGQQLSPGEQQRLGFARVLLIAPRWLFLDEATSALNEETEAALYSLLLTRLPGTAIVSIAHRPALAAYHQRRILFQPAATGTAFALTQGLVAA